MELVTILLIAVALAMDTFAVAISCGLTMKPFRKSVALRVAFSFGLFQALMPLAGWAMGLGFRGFISAFDHWVAFGLLLFVGGKMVHSAFDLSGDKEQVDPSDFKTLMLLSVATSIDALAVGLSLSFLKVSIMAPVIIIGMVTMVISFSGFFIGKAMGHFFESKIEIAGGVILIGIGAKILIQHLFGL